MNKKGHLFCIIIFFFITITGCDKEETIMPISLELMEVPSHFPHLEIPKDNGFTQERWALGKRLFYDEMLSIDSTISCGSCHHAAFAFSDDKALTPGVKDRVGTSNVPTLANVGFHPYFTREGGVPTLEMQVLVPIQEHNELDFNIVLIAERMKKDASYLAQSQEAYNSEPDAFVITRALANFERSLISGSSKYDRYLAGQDVLSEEELAGKALFFSERLNCGACHSSVLFTDFSFENNGLYTDYEALGRYRVTSDESDRAKFKVPSLRNIELTGPYMHDGSLPTLESIIDHYATGGNPHLNKSEKIKSFALTEIEKANLLDFLKTLTDRPFISNQNFKE